MNQKKNKKVLTILIIITSIILLCAGAAIVYLTTDIFKSDKELFFKYISKMTDTKEGLFDEDLTKYFEKRNNTPYNNESKLSFEVPKEYYQKTEIMDNFNITFSGQVDKANDKISQNISINYSDEVNFPINYRQISNRIGLYANNIVNKFIVIDTNELSEISKNQINIDSYQDTYKTIEKVTDIELNEEQINDILNTYTDILNVNLNDNNFSRVKENDLEGYKLLLEGENLRNILIKVLENLKNDQKTLDKINEYLKIQSNLSKISVSDIDKLIKNIQNENNFENNKLEITIYKKGGNAAKMSIAIENYNIVIEKNKNKDKQELKFSFENENIKLFTLTVNFEGLQSIQNVKENYELEIYIPKNTNSNESNVTTYKYTLNNDINFTDVSTIEDIPSENSRVLADYEKDQVNNYIIAVINKIKEVNKKQMQKLGLNENENPIMYCIPNLDLINNSSTIFSESNFNFGDASNNMSEVEVDTFNQKFLLYEGKNLSAQTIKGLLSVISLNNENNESRKIKEINFKGQEYDATETNITFIKEDIDLSKNYKVEFEKDENTGIIFRVIINEK